MVSVHKDFICYLEEPCCIHPSKAFQLLELSLDVCTGLSHKGIINHLLILRCLRVQQGVGQEHFTQSFKEIGGGLTHFLDYQCSFGHIDGFFGSQLKSM